LTQSNTPENFRNGFPKRQPPQDAYNALAADERNVIVMASSAAKANLQVGDVIPMATPSGQQD